MATTYEPIATTTVASGQVEVIFTSISQAYTDLVIVVSARESGADGMDMRVGNGSVDTGNNYSFQVTRANGSSVSPFRVANYSAMEVGLVNGTYSSMIINLQNYSNTTAYKTYLSRWGNTGWPYVGAHSGAWRSNSAINTINFKNGSLVNHLAGSTFTLYGIKAA